MTGHSSTRLAELAAVFAEFVAGNAVIEDAVGQIEHDEHVACHIDGAGAVVGPGLLDLARISLTCQIGHWVLYWTENARKGSVNAQHGGRLSLLEARRWQN